MRRAAAFVDFDAAALTALLNASFVAWRVTATATAAASAGRAPAALLDCGAERCLHVQRIDDDGRGLPAWCYGPIHMPVEAAPRFASLPALLVELRMELDRDYAPHPLVMAAPHSSAALS